METQIKSLEFIFIIIIGFMIAPLFTLEPGSCSDRCKINNFVKHADTVSSSCSCKPSCLKFGDCCWDYPLRLDIAKVMISTTCIAVEGHNSYLAINSCPKTWKFSTEFCSQSNEHLSPVSSISSGATYSNIHCAICNSDSHNVIIWDVLPQCKCHFSYRYAKEMCHCTYKPQNSNKLFVPDKIELRKCGIQEISTCSFAWSDKKTKKYCESYLDPVYIYDRVYKNLHCAACNFATIEKATCIPDIMKTLYKRHLNAKDIKTYCENYNLKSCLHYITTTKGKPYAFANLISVSMQTCIPPPNRKCCRKEKYDYRQKICIKVR